MTFYSLEALSESDMNPHHVHICTHEILLRILLRENVSLLSQFCGLELRQLTRHLVVRIRGQDALGLHIHLYQNAVKENQCFASSSENPNLTKLLGMNFIFKHQRGRKNTHQAEQMLHDVSGCSMV